MILFFSSGLTLINFPSRIDDSIESDRNSIKAILDFVYVLGLNIAYVVRQSDANRNATVEP